MCVCVSGSLMAGLDKVLSCQKSVHLPLNAPFFYVPHVLVPWTLLHPIWNSFRCQVYECDITILHFT